MEHQLPTSEHEKYWKRPNIATSVIAEYTKNGEKGLVLIERKNYPFGYALVGGFLEEELTPKENALKELKEESNLDARIKGEMEYQYLREDPDMFDVLTAVHRDPRGRMIDIVYKLECYGTIRAGDDAAKAHFYSHAAVKSMFDQHKFAFDHEDILKRYYAKKEMVDEAARRHMMS